MGLSCSFDISRREFKSRAGENLDPQPGGSSTSIYGLNRYVPRDRVGFLRFSILK